jgi:hypothetical protein
MANSLRQVQQGDVLLQQVEGLPRGAIRDPQRGRLVLARGEATGHTHAVQSGKAALWSLTRDGVAELYLEVLEPVVIVHDEHKPLAVPAGIYRVGRVKEYDHLAGMERRVVD